MMKKMISALLSVVIVLASMLTISAVAPTIEIVQNVFTVTATVTSDTDLGRLTAYVKQVKDIDGNDVNDSIIYGIGQKRVPEVDGKYTYEFNFIMRDSVPAGKYKLFLGNGSTKEYEYQNNPEKVNFYNSLHDITAADLTANENVIYDKLTGATEGDRYLIYDISVYEALSTPVRQLVDKEIETWDLSTDSVYDNPDDLAATESTFASKMDEVLSRAVIVNANPESFDADVEAAIANPEIALDDTFYDKVNAATVASFMNSAAVTSIQTAVIKKQFSKAVFLSVAKESDYLTLYDATDYFINNSILNLDDAKLDLLVRNNLHYTLFSNLKTKALKQGFATVADYENAARPLMNTLIAQIGSAPSGNTSSQRPVGPSQGIPIGSTTRPTTPEKDDGLVDNPATFTDLGNVSWAQEAIEYLSARGIVAGRGNGIFAPNDTVTREEMVKLIVKAFSDENSGAVCSFADVATDRWSYPYIATASNLGLITGIDATTFDPAGGITRENLAVILFKAYKLTGSEINAPKANFKDGGNIANYAKDAVNAMVKLGIMEGVGNNTFSPKTVVTRAQAAKVIYKLLAVIGGGI